MDRVENDDSMVFAAVEYLNLKPGFLYVFRTRGLNVAGEGPWSELSYSAYTRPTRPHPPPAPYIVSATLRSILFGWHPPDDGGSAIIGYRIHMLHNNKFIDLPRSSVTHLFEGLFPGRSYRVRVLSKNVVGESDWSEWNLETESYTLTGVPETPANPLAVDGTWNSLTLEARIPFGNGARVTGMIVEQRFIEPFQLGEWESPSKFSYHIPDEVEVVEYVDLDQQQIDIEMMIAKLDLMKASAGFNPYSKANKKLNAEIEGMFEQQV